MNDIRLQKFIEEIKILAQEGTEGVIVSPDVPIGDQKLGFAETGIVAHASPSRDQI